MKQPARAPLSPRAQRLLAWYIEGLRLLEAEAKTSTDNAQQGAEPAATAAR